MEQTDIQAIVRSAIEEFTRSERDRNEPAHKAELLEERKRREQLEKRLNELAEEARRSRKLAEETERGATIRSELQRLGVAKVEIAYKAVQDAIVRTEDGKLIARGDAGEVPVKEYLAGFVSENPEFLPARIPGGSGMIAAHKAPGEGHGAVDLERIRPGMSKEEMERARQEIARVASLSLRGQ